MVSFNSLVVAIAALSGANADVFGNYYNYWNYSGNNFDLTRGGSSDPKTIPTFSHKNSTITIAPERSVLAIVDMQNFFLHPDLSPKATGGRAAVTPTLAMIDAFRTAGMKICWVQWGLTAYDLRTISPSFLYGFSDGVHANTSFGSEMGLVGEIDAGQKLMRGSWNAQQYGPLYDSYIEGVYNGTDYFFNKNTLSGLWGRGTPFELWLDFHNMTTVFYGGVNADQCVFGTMIDSVFKGFDTIMVEDMCATTSPQYAYDMVVYNIGSDGWTTNSTQVINAII
jgi:nicotinamidase-related amidase